MISAGEQSELIRGIAAADGYEFREFTSAADIKGNFKISLPEALGRNDDLMQRFVGHMATELTGVDVLVATGGAVSLAEAIAQETDLPLVEMVKLYPYKKGSNIMKTKNGKCDDILAKRPRIGCIEDVTSTRQTIEHIANKHSTQGLVDVIVTGWRRGELAPEGMTAQDVMIHNRKFAYRSLFELPSEVPIKAVIERKVPLWIPQRSQVAAYLPELEEL
jgi:hypothetical protein